MFTRLQPICGLLLAAGVISALAMASPSHFQQKKQAEKKSAGEKPPAEKIAKGKELFGTWCEICHFDKSSEKKVGPGLKGLFKRAKFADGRKVDEASLRAWIEKGGKDMPGFGDSLKAEEIQNLIAYIKTL
jgi:cytochrome c